MSDNVGAPAGDLERRLATILSADVAEYSRLMAEDEEETLRVFRGHKEVFEKLVALHRGRIFNTAGDAILAEFGSAVEAVRCATEIQAALRTRNDQLHREKLLRGFTKRYNVFKLVYYEVGHDPSGAIARESSSRPAHDKRKST